MVAGGEQLRRLRDHIQTMGGGFLRNVQWLPGVTCSTCAGIPGQGYAECYKCSTRSSGSGLADQLGFITYGWADHQTGRTMHAYKAGGATSKQLVSLLLTYAVVGHWDCIARVTGSYPDGWAYVPSLANRRGQHPLEGIAQRFMNTVPNVPMSANATPSGARTFNPDHFTVQPTRSQHVLLLDDTWTTGGHVQSAAAALKQGGVQRVTALVVARWLDPSWGGTADFIRVLPPTFDPDLCPYTGRHC